MMFVNCTFSYIFLHFHFFSSSLTLLDSWPFFTGSFYIPKRLDKAIWVFLPLLVISCLYSSTFHGAVENSRLVFFSLLGTYEGGVHCRTDDDGLGKTAQRCFFFSLLEWIVCRNNTYFVPIYTNCVCWLFPFMFLTCTVSRISSQVLGRSKLRTQHIYLSIYVNVSMYYYR